MIVIIAGMWRSGSTFAFNVARDVLRKRGTVFQESSVNLNDAVELSGGADHILLKAHSFDLADLSQREVRVICTIRRVEDAFASWIEAFRWEEDQTMALMHDWMLFYQAIQKTALTVHYRQVDRLSWLAALRIGRYVAPDVTPWEAFAIARRHGKAKVKRRADAMRLGDPNTVDLGFTYCDNQTLFHRRHVSTLRSRPAEQRLEAETLQRVRAELGRQAADLGIS